MRVGRTACLLGFAGLLPAVGAAGLLAVGERAGVLMALFYPLLILSFLGGMWWGFAMRRGEGQGRLVVMAVVPSLVALALFLCAVASLPAVAGTPWVLVAIGCAVILTLPVDRHLVRTGDAPEGWMRLRVPLSLGLGGLTILSGVLLGRL